jgi:hypothetical protein
VTECWKGYSGLPVHILAMRDACGDSLSESGGRTLNINYKKCRGLTIKIEVLGA